MANNQQGAGNRGGSGNFAGDRQRASEAGQKGGEHSHGNPGQASGTQPKTTQQGSGATFSHERANASDPTKKGGPNY